MARTAKLRQKSCISSCKCLPAIQEWLAERNAAVSIELLINFKTGKTSNSPPQLKLHKLDEKSRKRLPTVFCAHCPFCGKKYRK